MPLSVRFVPARATRARELLQDGVWAAMKCRAWLGNKPTVRSSAESLLVSVVHYPPEVATRLADGRLLLVESCARLVDDTHTRRS